MPAPAVYSLLEKSPLREHIEQVAAENEITVQEEAERRWEKAKTIAEKQYELKETAIKKLPADDPKRSQFYALVMGIYKKMLGYKNESDFTPSESVSGIRIAVSVVLS